MKASGQRSGLRLAVGALFLGLAALSCLVAAQTPGGEPLKIGAVLSLTGPGAGLGLAGETASNSPKR
jgi:hypothetical protein